MNTRELNNIFNFNSDNLATSTNTKIHIGDNINDNITIESPSLIVVKDNYLIEDVDEQH